jgi:hypothetical protein
MYSSNANPDLVSKLCNSSVQMLLRLHNFRKEWPKDLVRPSNHVLQLRKHNNHVLLLPRQLNLVRSRLKPIA